MTIISTQTVCMCSPSRPQPGTCRKSPVSLSSLKRQPSGPRRLSSSNGHYHSTLTTTHALPQSPFFSSLEDDASDDNGVPAKDTHLRHITGTKTMELANPISLAQVVDDQLPPLFTMVIDGFPPWEISKYVDEAEIRLHQYFERYQNVVSLDSYYRAGLCAAAYGHPKVINVDRLVAIAINYGLQFLLDDLFFDTPNEFLEDQYGISRGARVSPESIQEYLDHLDGIFSQQLQPCNPISLIETIMQEAGQYTLGLTNPEWFNYYVANVMEHHRAGVVSLVDIAQGQNLYFQDVESYANMRAGNVGGKFIQMMVELANDSYIPSILRTDPYLEKLTTATSIHLGFINDVFSYHKESFLEQNPRNLITVLLKCEGKSFVQTVHMAIDVVNTYAHVIMDLEAEAWSSILENYMQGIKELIAGNFYFSYMDYRYRHADSIFPELRDTTSSWKIFPHAPKLEL